MSRFIDFAPEGEGAGEGGGTGEGSGEGQGTEASFTQADLDRIVRERLARQKAQYQDYEELKGKASEYDKLAEAQKTELQKATERAAEAERLASEAQDRAKALVTESAITAAAAGKLADPTDALALVDRAAIEFGDDGRPSNIGALIDALVTSKPHLAAGGVKAPPVDQGAQGGKSSPLDPAHMSDADFMAALRDPSKLAALNAQTK